MPDVLIVCVREDVERAEALAAMFDGLGYSVGDDPSDEWAQRACGAGVVVWSRDAVRSRPFRLMVQRLIEAGKAVAAIVDDTPAPDYLARGRVFDVSGWSGGADDPKIDPLFFAVDRLVSAATHTITPVRVAPPVIRHTRRVAFGPPVAAIIEPTPPVAVEPAPEEAIAFDFGSIEPEQRPARKSVNVRELAAASSRQLRKINPAGAAIAVMLIALVGAAGWNNANVSRESKGERRENAVTLTAALVDSSTVDMSEPAPAMLTDLPSPREPASAPHFAIHALQRTAAHVRAHPDSAELVDAAAPHWTSWSGVPAPTSVSYVPPG